jgi:hypothetical protein
MLASVRSNGIAMRANTEATIREETKARPPTSIRDHEVSFLKPGTATPPPADSEEKPPRGKTEANTPGGLLVTEGLFGLFSRLQAVHSFDHERSPCS